MKYNDFIRAIRAGALDVNEDYWVCDYLQSATEIVIETPPVRAKLKSEAAPLGAKNYSFQPYGKSGKILSRPVQNSCFQFSNGLPTGARLQVFLNEQDCYEAYIRLCEESKAAAEEEKKALLEGMQAIEDKVNENIRSATARQTELNTLWR